MTKKFYRHKLANLINVQKIVTVHYQELGEGYVSAGEAHDFWEIIYADRRSAVVTMDEKKYPLEQGEAVFIAPNISHFVECPAAANLFILSFECRSESMELFRGRVMEIPPSRRTLLQDIMSEAAHTFRIPDFDPSLRKLELLAYPELGGEQALKNLLELLLIYLLREENEGTARYFVSAFESSSDLEEAIVKYLADHLAEPLSLDKLCAELHYGKTHLCTLFKEQTGKSIYKTYLDMKISEAKRLIRSGMTVAEVSEKLAFSSPSHFIGVFKSRQGCTPHEYSESVRK